MQTKHKIVCPTKKLVTFKNYHKQHEVDNVIFTDVECYMEGMNRSIGDNMFVISKHVHISVGFSFNNDCYKDYFGTDCFIDF